MIRKLVVLSAGAFNYEPWGIFKDEEQLRKRLMEDWGLEEGFDLDEALERSEMIKFWCDDYSDN